MEEWRNIVMSDELHILSSLPAILKERLFLYLNKHWIMKAWEERKYRSVHSYSWQQRG
jgi:hypothetical protein